MARRYDAVVFDLGDVLFHWDPSVVTALPKTKFRAMMTTTIWSDFDRGFLSAEEAYKLLAKEVNTTPELVREALEQAQKTLYPDPEMTNLILKLGSARMWPGQPRVHVFGLSNITKVHFESTQKAEFPWHLFDRIVTSCGTGMRKPGLGIYQFLLREAGIDPSRTIFLDDKAENVFAARSLGLRGELVGRLGPERSKLVALMTNLLLPNTTAIRAEGFLRSRAGRHFSEMDGGGIINDNFSQLLIYGLTGLEELICLGWPTGSYSPALPPTPPATVHGSIADSDSDGVLTPPISDDERQQATLSNSDLWNYYAAPHPQHATSSFPPDADTTSIAYLSLAEPHLRALPSPALVLNAMLSNINGDGIMQVYFDSSRPRVCPVVCVNMLRLFSMFSTTSIDTSPGLAPTIDFVVSSLANRAYIYGCRYYIPDAFLYFCALLHSECKPTAPVLWQRLDAHMRPTLVEQLGTLAEGDNAMALAMRIRACQVAGVDKAMVMNEFEQLLRLQNAEDGGWPAGCFCKFGKTGKDVGNRGLTTAVVWRVLKEYDGWQ
ncbi:HAD-like domain-containing protein [Podospora didyma]|uniref:HAD-like domain-containing protein n=1 Tax=Podospora didyma TaxID=330526 RepID=A0AAE0P3L2_9PEZI|nr:HAD-like domain-containing protein [Podospora didyma]